MKITLTSVSGDIFLDCLLFLVVFDGDKMATCVVLLAVAVRLGPVQILEHNMIDAAACTSHRRIENNLR